MYSKELMEIMKSYLDFCNYKYDFDEETAKFRFTVSSENEIEEELYTICIEPHSYSIISGFVNIDIIDSKFDEISEYINRINARIPFVHFSIYDNVIIRSHRLNCNGIIPDHALIDDCFKRMRHPAKQFVQGVVDIINGVGTAKELFEKYESEAM